MKPIVHAVNVVCNHLHVKESYDLRNVTCLACKNLLRSNKEVRDNFNFLADRKRSQEKLRLRELDIKIMNSDDETIKHIKKNIFCLKCGRTLKKRLNKKTKEYFIGCSGFPRCKSTMQYDRKYDKYFE